MYSTIYHPRFEPEENWLRAMLLFYDTVHSIVPEGAGYQATPRIARLQDKVSNAFLPLSPNKEDREVFSEEGGWYRYHALTAFLDELDQEGASAERVSAPYYVKNGVVHLTLDHAVAVHYDKLGQMFIDELTARNLALVVEKPVGPTTSATSQATGTHRSTQWLYVDKRIATLSLSLLAERMREHRSEIKHTSSDEALCFGVAAKTEMKREEHRTRWNTQARLATAIVKAQVPDALDELSLDDYLEIRKRYEEYRDTFHLAVAEIETLHLDRTFTTERELEAAIEGQLTDFSAGIEKIKARTQTKRIKKWSAITLQRIIPVIGAVVGTHFGMPVLATGAGGVFSYALDFFRERAGQAGPGTYMIQAQALFASLQRDLSGEAWMTRVFV
jgi:hypothetical protein